MYEDMPCMHMILHIGKSSGNQLQWTTNGKYCIGVGIGRKTNDNMSMDEYVADADECDQQPYGERDKAKSPESKVGEQILQSPAN